MTDGSSGGDAATGSEAEQQGHTQVPEESAASESDLSLSAQVAARENDDEQDDG